MTVWVLAKRSMRFYEKNVQYNDRTDKKLEGFLPHAQHLLSDSDRGGKEEADRLFMQKAFPYDKYITQAQNL